MTADELVPQLCAFLQSALAEHEAIDVIAYDATDYEDRFEAARARRGLCVVVGWESSALHAASPLTLANRLVVGIFENRPTNTAGPSALDVTLALAKAIGVPGDDGLSEYNLHHNAIDSGERDTAAVNTFFLTVNATTIEDS